ncbi:hypothetical protein MGE33_04330 [Wolbachia pipientis]|nr:MULTISPECIES: hypothetical protein [Wolbachia]QQL96428.1 hypothetical protein GQX71_04390 [Wolbachia endosymbiont of Drosophila melanogaster]QQL97571.1 hypothetical protein GQX70_04400 [Wolbachia endosymbiont of Drosophila melanogaster]QQL99926.1 hypothetical protein GQX68_04270 [Wolbachia endosymbiont of Drosophila melanogaster]QQM01061.1 hypothetical protein GQX67_04285 [Wolbachia endosymbiont of Drosophila melanogaster]UJA57791.1 hypothetical protein L0Z57_04345 [Wolbachia endosymbiont o
MTRKEHWDDKKEATWITEEGGYLDNTLTTIIPLRVSGIWKYRGGMT